MFIRHLRLIVWLAALFGLSFMAPRAEAAPALSPAGSAKSEKPGADGVEEEKVAPDSPRAAFVDFIHLTRVGDYVGAAKYLDLSKADAGEGPRLAQHLKEVLSRRLWLEPSKLSPESRGNAADNQPTDREELGTIRGASGKLEPVTLVRKSRRPGAHWVFSAETVAQIEGWYDHLENVWLSERLPKPLLEMGPRLLRWWQWLALVPLLLVAWGISYVVTRSARAVVKRALSDTHAGFVRQLHGPVALALMVGVVFASLPWLGLYQPAAEFLHRWCSAFLLIALFWALWRGVELSRRTVSASQWARESSSAPSLLSLGTRVAKFAVAAAAFVFVLSQLGYQATTIITGLGIGGVALALAAQKTVENLFGTFSLAIDQPFREGDNIKVDGIEGVVESVGWRSTRIRTPDRTVISIPNGKLADMRVETVSRQDRLRFFCAFGLAHAAASELEHILDGIKALVSSETLADPKSISVRLVALTDSGLNIEVGAMLTTTDGTQFLDARERLLLGILRVVSATGAKLAHPARVIELISPSGQERVRDSAPRLSQTG